MKYYTAVETNTVNFVWNACQGMVFNLNKETNTCDDDIHLFSVKKKVFLCVCVDGKFLDRCIGNCNLWRA